MLRYQNLDALLKENEKAKDYFSALPNNIKGQLLTKGNKIYSEIDLIEYSEGLIHEFV